MTAAIGYAQLLRENQPYRRLWFGEVVSFLGDWFNTIAIYTAVQAISSSGQAVAAVMIAKTLPAFLVMPVAGPLIDRFDRRGLLIATDVIRALAVVGLILSHHAGSLAGLYVFTVVMMLCAGVAFPTKNAIIPRIVERKDLVVANALSGGTWSVMLALGAALGGAATSAVGVTWAFVIDGTTFVLSALFFLGLPALQPPGARSARHRTSFLEGLRYLKRTRYMIALVSLKPMMALAGGALVLIPIFGSRVFAGREGPLFVGLLFAARGLGALVGSVGIRLFFGDTPRTLRRLVLAGYVVIGSSYALVGSADAYWQAVLGFFLAAIGSGMIWVFSGTLLQAEGDDAYHGRLFSLEFGLTTLAIAGSSWVAGAALDWGYTPHQVALACALVPAPALLVWGTVLLVVKRRLQRRARERLRFFYEVAAAEAAELARFGAAQAVAERFGAAEAAAGPTAERGPGSPL